MRINQNENIDLIEISIKVKHTLIVRAIHNHVRIVKTRPFFKFDYKCSFELSMIVLIIYYSDEQKFENTIFFANIKIQLKLLTF